MTVFSPMLEISRSCSLSDSMFVHSVSTMVSTWYSFTLPTSGPRLSEEKRSQSEQRRRQMLSTIKRDTRAHSSLKAAQPQVQILPKHQYRVPISCSACRVPTFTYPVLLPQLTVYQISVDFRSDL